MRCQCLRYFYLTTKTTFIKFIKIKHNFCKNQISITKLNMLKSSDFDTFNLTRFLSASRELTAVAVRHVLIIDDEEDIREVVELTLQTVGGWEVTTAVSGIEGLAIAKEQQPDAILLDMMMPDLDGIGTLTLLRAAPETQHIPVILITAKEKNVDRSQLALLGVTAIIGKPFDPMTLVAEVANYLGWTDI